MQDWGAPTGSLPVVRELIGLQSFPPQTVSVRAARRFVQQCLVGTPMDALADDAGLLVCELAANAVLHARTDFDVAVSALQDRSGVRVTVRDDAEALPTVTAPSATAMSGRGLALVQTLAARWGAGPSSSARKGVWFELDLAADIDDAPAEDPLRPGTGRAPAAAVAEPSVEELLAAWSDNEHIPETTTTSSGVQGDEQPAEVGRAPLTGPRGEREVVLPPLDAADLLAAKESMDDLLRELQLVLLAPQDLSPHSAEAEGLGGGGLQDEDAAPDGMDIARRLDAAARRFDAVRRQVRHQVNLAAAAGQEVVRLRLLLPEGTYPAAMEYMAAVEAAEVLAEHGGLLSSGARTLRRHHAVRRAYLGEVIAAAEA